MGETSHLVPDAAAIRSSSAAAWQRRLSVVIPAFDEENGIGKTLADLTAQLPEAEIIVVNDASRDRTADEIRKFERVTLVTHAFNRGYGGALKTGMQLATREFVAWFDADNEHRVADLAAMAELIAANPLAAVIGTRQSSGTSPLRSWGKAVIRSIARTLDVRVGSDINCGLRVFRRDVIEAYAPLLPNGFSASITSLMILLERRYPIAFHAIGLNPRIGRSKVRIGDGFEAIMIVLNMVMLFAPLRIFLRAGGALLAIGLLYGVSLALMRGAGIPVAAVLAMLTGVLICVLGLIAGQISHIRLSALEHSIHSIEHDARRSAREGEASGASATAAGRAPR